jgi:hypothetical protein
MKIKENADFLPVVCLAVGDSLPDYYIERLYRMLSRHLKSQPVKLLCFTDRTRKISSEIEQRDCSDWNDVKREGMRVTTQKLRLFDGVTVPYEEFFYFDLTLVVRNDLQRLVDYAQSRPEPLVIVKDWDYDSYNSCVMRIKPEKLKIIYESFVAGQSYTQRIKGDQEFITRCLEANSLQKLVATFPVNEVASYKAARNLNRKDRAAAIQILEAASVVKFHGRPKPHELLDPVYNFLKIRLKHPKDASFWVKELRQNWLAE